MQDVVEDISACSARGEDAPDALETALQAGVAYAVAVQERAGVEVVSDGELRRKSYLGVVAELAHGFSTGTRNGVHHTIIRDPLTTKNPGFIVHEVTSLKKITSRPVRVALPAPGLLGERLYDPELSRDAYQTREQFVEATVPFLRKELELLKAAGCSQVQIDDPHLCLFVDEDVRRKHPDCEGAAAFAVAMINKLVDGLADDSFHIAVHLCRRAGGRARGDAAHAGPYQTILTHLNNLQVNELVMEFSSPEAGAEAAILQSLRDDFSIGYGCVGVTPGVIDATETIVERVENALKFISPDRLRLNPDCGFAPGSTAKVDMDEVFMKLSNMAAAGKVLRQKYSTDLHRREVPPRPKRRVYLDGIFDLFHVGHLRALQHGKTCTGGDVHLIAGVVGDDIAEPYKRRPVVNEDDRAAIVGALPCVDEVVVPAPLEVTEAYLKEHSIDTVIHGFADEADKAKFMTRCAVPVELGVFKETPYTFGVSTSQLLKGVANKV